MSYIDMLENIKTKIKSIIHSNISPNDLNTICQIFKIPINDQGCQKHKALIDSIATSSDFNLLQQVLYIITKSNNLTSNQMESNQQRPLVTYTQTVINGHQNHINNSLNYRQPTNNTNLYNLSLYAITMDTVDKCPVNIRTELSADVNCRQIFSPTHTKYPADCMCVPSIKHGIKYQNIQIPYVCRNTIIQPSSFYCSQVILHPISLLIPKPLPDALGQHRIMSKMVVNFTLTRNAQNLIIKNRTFKNNKFNYKWQVVIRFGVYDSTETFPDISLPRTDVTECLPPYLAVWINNSPVPLWDILPSNSVAKEGKRHPRPVNVTDYLNFTSSYEGIRQNICFSWWQTPLVFNYYYFGIFLERKIAVEEYLQNLENRVHKVQRPISYTIELIKSKFASNKAYAENDIDDDDIVIASVLPVSLLCPIGRSRISCPLRGLSCQHLQCFDAHLYLLMNERRSVWKCPVCDNSATMNDLFIDEYFLSILERFKGNDSVTEVNIHSDASFTPVVSKKEEENLNKVRPKDDLLQQKDCVPETVSLLDSDDEKSMISEEIVVKKDVQESIPHFSGINAWQPESCLNNAVTIDLTSDNEESDEPFYNFQNEQSEHMPINMERPHQLHIDSQTENNTQNPTRVTTPPLIFPPHTSGNPPIPLSMFTSSSHQNFPTQTAQPLLAPKTTSQVLSSNQAGMMSNSRFPLTSHNPYFSCSNSSVTSYRQPSIAPHTITHPLPLNPNIPRPIYPRIQPTTKAKIPIPPLHISSQKPNCNTSPRPSLIKNSTILPSSTKENQISNHNTIPISNFLQSNVISNNKNKLNIINNARSKTKSRSSDQRFNDKLKIKKSRLCVSFSERRRSSRIKNQNQITYKESSGESQSEYEYEDSTDISDYEDDCARYCSSSSEEEVPVVNKFTNLSEDNDGGHSLSSVSSGATKRKRLVPADNEIDETRNTGMSKYPIVYVTKLDPTVMNLFLRNSNNIDNNTTQS